MFNTLGLCLFLIYFILTSTQWCKQWVCHLLRRVKTNKCKKVKALKINLYRYMMRDEQIERSTVVCLYICLHA